MDRCDEEYDRISISTLPSSNHDTIEVNTLQEEEDISDDHQNHISTLEKLLQAIRASIELAPIRTGAHAYYEQQEQLLTHYLELANRKIASAEEEALRREEEEQQYSILERLNKIAMYLSFGAGVPLVALTITAFFLSGSMALLATALDSILDQLSQLIMMISIWFMGKTKRNKHLFPAGNRRIEPLGLVVFSAIMMTAFFDLIISSIEDLASGAIVEFDFRIGLIVGVNILIKGSLWIFCWLVSKRTNSSTVEAFSQDHRNDVFVNLCAVLAMIISATAGLAWHWVDSVVAILLSCWIIYSWAETLYEVLYQLAGTSAPPALVSAVLYLAKNFHTSIIAVESVRAWHLSENFIVELDIVLPPTMPLIEAHQIGEDLQHLIEGIDQVERAFVHLDVDYHHPPEH